MRTISETLDNLELGTSIETGHLTVIPLRTRVTCAPGYLTLDDAISSRHLRITEVSHAGWVSELTVANDCDLPVLIFDGEELLGAKQDRIVNLTILVAPHSRLTIPVSCVEQGRWSYTRPDFVPAGRAHYVSARAMTGEHVTASMRARGSHGSNQAAIWHHIALKSAHIGARSTSGASSAMFAHKRAQLDALRAGVTPGAHDIGAVFLIGGQPAGLELCDSPASWRTLLPKLVDSYGLDAVDGEGRVDEDAMARAKRFVDVLRRVSADQFAGVGLGCDLRFDSPDVSGRALAWNDRIVHLAAFARLQRQDSSPRLPNLLDRLVSWVKWNPGSVSARERDG